MVAAAAAAIDDAALPPARGGGWRLPPTPFGARGARLSLTDLIVTVGGVLLLLAGWGLVRAHDARVVAVEVAGAAIARPAGWLPLPALPPALATWTDDGGLGATLTLYAEPTDAATATEAMAVAVAGANPAIGQPAYTPLRSEPATRGGQPAVRSDYAYARTEVARSTPPTVVMGRQLAWVADGTLYLLALEAPEADWGRVAPLFDRLAGAGEGGAS